MLSRFLGTQNARCNGVISSSLHNSPRESHLAGSRSVRPKINCEHVCLLVVMGVVSDPDAPVSVWSERQPQT